MCILHVYLGAPYVFIFNKNFLTYQENHCMIGKWIWSLRSLIFCTPSSWEKVAKTKYVVFLQLGGGLRLDLSISHFALPLDPHFLGRAFGELSLLRELHL
jgi:hypothetical protein